MWNTVQAYLKNSFTRIQFELDRATFLDQPLGVKLVRGAYMVVERKLAKENNYESPINEDITATHEMFDKCTLYMLENMNKKMEF